MENLLRNNKIGLVIERTSNGLDFDYVSAGLNKHELGSLQISFDETNEVGQFNQGYCYSTKRTERHLIYSIINTQYKDSANRNGFFALRLIVKQNELIENISSHFSKLTSQYLMFLQANNLNSQNYSELLDHLAKDVKFNGLISPKAEVSRIVYYQFININEDQSTLFNRPKLNSTNKVYFLNDKSASSDGIARQFGFQPLDTFWSKVKEIQFSNPNRFSITINVNTATFCADMTKFIVVCNALDEVKYKIASERELTSVLMSENDISIQKPKYNSSPPVRASNFDSSQKDLNKSVLPWIVGIFLGLIGGYFIHPFVEEFLVNQPTSAYEETSGVENKQPPIEIDTAAANVIHLITKSEQLNEYVFKYDGGKDKWSYYKPKVKSKFEDTKLYPLTLKDLDSLLNKALPEQINAIKEGLQSFASTPIPKEADRKQQKTKNGNTALVKADNSLSENTKNSKKEQEKQASGRSVKEQSSTPAKAKKLTKGADSTKKGK